ncbi:hypothetical protein SCHPADRAFT_892243 [Schizopora paradoxa]|uniref:DUF6533 domain-containing protein n=1 Tax=Schizopora paradoxa TaxID=27342 RepID=A0A0H2RMB9_9AGAM|nr:hypothetical protein SCHPADRAFT_892243 [Schizopora paradoxa]
MSQPPPAVLAAIIEAGNGVLQTKFTHYAALGIVFYDHLLTLDIEIEYIWKRKFSAVTVLFFLTRYYFIFFMTFSQFVFVDPVNQFTNTTLCERILLIIPIGGGAALTALPDCMIALRIYALYERNKKLGFALLIFILAQLGVSLWIDILPSVTRISTFGPLGYPELDNVPTMRFCLTQVSSRLTSIETSLGQIFQAIFDTVTLSLILYKARRQSNSGLVTLIAKQGLAYYMLNVATYLTWTFMLIFAPPSLKSAMGGLVCVSVNRLTLHLRSYSDKTEFGDGQRSITSFSAKRQRRNSWLGASTLEVVNDSVTSVDSDDGTSSFELHEAPSSDHKHSGSKSWLSL